MRWGEMSETSASFAILPKLPELRRKRLGGSRRPSRASSTVHAWPERSPIALTASENATKSMDWYQKSAACVGWTYDETAPPRVLTCSGRRSSDWDDLRWVDRVSSIFDDAVGGVN